MKGGGKCTTTWCSSAKTLEDLAQYLASCIIDSRIKENSMPTQETVMETAIFLCSNDSHGDYIIKCNSVSTYGVFKLTRYNIADVVGLAMQKLQIYYSEAETQKREQREQDELTIKGQLIEIYNVYANKRIKELEEKRKKCEDECAARFESLKSQYLNYGKNHDYYDTTYFNDWLSSPYAKQEKKRLQEELLQQRQPTRAGTRKYAKRRTRKRR